jgi:hypothetical protein
MLQSDISTRFNYNNEGNSHDLWENTDFSDDQTSCSSDNDSEWDTELNNPILPQT